MNDKDYDRAVRSIPHLNLTKYLPKIPCQEIIQEVQTENNYIRPFEYGIDTSKRKEMKAVVDYLSDSWQGFGIVDITARGDHMIDYLTEDITHERVKALGIEFDDSGYGIYKPTDVGSRMATTIEYIQEIFHCSGRVRLSRLGAGRLIGYHNHEVKSMIDRQRLSKPLISPGVNRSTLHIPLIENNRSAHYVTKGHAVDFVDSDRFVLEKHAVEYVQHYAVGEAWLFNSVHYHKAVNFGDTDRTHILCYFDHMDIRIRPRIEKAIRDYQGPHIV